MKSPTTKSKARPKAKKSLRKGFSEMSLLLDEGAVGRCFMEFSRVFRVVFSSASSPTNHFCQIVFNEKFTDTPLRDAYISAITATIERVFDTKTSRVLYPLSDGGKEGNDNMSELTLFYNIRKATNFNENKYDGVVFKK